MIIAEFGEKAKKILEHFKDELKQIRTGRANTSLIEDLPVLVESYGGARMKLKELGLVSAPEPALLTVQVFDPSVMKDIEKAIQAANTGLQASPDGQMLRIPVPPLTQERREQLIKVVSQKLEESRVAVRSLRTQVKEDIEGQKGAGVSEDDVKRQVEELQKEVEKVTASLEQLAKEKEAELRQI